MTTIVLSAGGTGGHLFPAQALAAELMRRGRKIVVMTDARGTQYPTYFPARVDRDRAVGGVLGSLDLGLMTAPFEIMAGIIVATIKLARARPAAVVGFGGYPSLPVMIAACLARFPTVIVAPDAVLGRANRIVAELCARHRRRLPLKRFLPKDMSKVVYTGNPVRPEVVAQKDAPYDAPAANGPLRLLVFGGSQGARAFSEIVPAAIALLPADHARAARHRAAMPSGGSRTGARVLCEERRESRTRAVLQRSAARMARAHLVIGRSGAGTVAELMVIGRPAILVPLPHALDDNQTPNADALADAGGGWRVAQKRSHAEETGRDAADGIFATPGDLAKRAAAAHAAGKPDAAARLADLVDRIGGA